MNLLELPPLSFEVEEAEPILSDRAYKHTETTVAGLRRSLEEYRARGGSELEPAMRQMVMDGMQSLIDEWSRQMRDYEQLKSGDVTLSLHSLRDLPTLLVKARVAAGLSQKQLAARLDLKPQQIQRYEATRYRTITLTRMLQITEALGVRFDGAAHLGAR